MDGMDSICGAVPGSVHPASEAHDPPRWVDRYADGLNAAGLIFADSAAFLASVASAFLCTDLLDVHLWQRGPHAIGPEQLQHSAASLTLVFCAVAASFFLRGHYRERIPFWNELGHIYAASALALLVMGFLQFSTRGTASRPLLVGCWLVFPFAAMAFRRAAKRFLDRAGVWRVPVVVVADERGLANLCDLLAHDHPPGFRVVGVLDAAESAGQPARVGWRSVLKRFGARRLLLAFSIGAAAERALIESIVRERVAFALIPDERELPVAGCRRISYFSQDVVLVSYRNNLSEPLLRFSKAVFDLCLAGMGLLVLLPVMLALALLVGLDGGPILFAHERIGEGGRRFKCLKFRTMVVDADRVLRELLANDPAAAAEWAATRKLTHDPRVTRVGVFLRETSLDELPQLLNVMRLEMSLVGPRPIVEQEVQHYAGDISYYYETRPGLTGLWQVSGRSNTSYEQRIRYDKWYVKNWTAWCDLAIIAKTIPAVLKRTGAR